MTCLQAELTIDCIIEWGHQMEKQEEREHTLGGVWWQEGNIVQLLDGALGCTGTDKVSRCFTIHNMTLRIAQVASQAASHQTQQVHQLGSIKELLRQQVLTGLGIH